MDPRLIGLVIIYATNVMWAMLFGIWGFVAAKLFQQPGLTAKLFRGRNFVRLGDGPRLEIGMIPFPSAFVRHEDRAPSSSISMPFIDLSLAKRAFALLGPWVVLVPLAALFTSPTALAKIPTDVISLVRGTLSPLGTGTDLARGFLRHLGQVPPIQAVGMVLEKQIVCALLPIGTGSWRSVRAVIQPRSLQDRPVQDVGSPLAVFTATMETGILLGISGAWIVMIVRAVLF